jgi:NADPH:quinone reductase-like Zn-dependent oxidoreductase
MKASEYKQCGPPEVLQFIRKLIEVEKIRPVIDRSFPLEQITDAHRHADTGHQRGRVGISLF